MLATQKARALTFALFLGFEIVINTYHGSAFIAWSSISGAMLRYHQNRSQPIGILPEAKVAQPLGGRHSFRG